MWLDKLMSMTEELEAPQSYFFWSGLATISAIVKDRVFLNRGKAFNLYPNIYVLLHGDSGLRKGLPTSTARKIADNVGNTKVMWGRTSIQALITELATARSLPGGRNLMDSCGFAISSEFSSSIINDPMAIKILTELYDRNYQEGKWINRLKTTGNETLKSPTLTILGGTNDEQLADVITKRDIYGGFIGRTFMIREREVNTLNSLMFEPKTVLDTDALSEYPKKLANTNGEFQMSKELRKEANKWYMDYMRDKSIIDKTGTRMRMLDSILKVAMLLSLCRDTSLEIDREDWNLAKEKCMPLIYSAKRTTMSEGESPLREQKKIVINCILEAPKFKADRENILARNYAHFDTHELNRIIETFVEGKNVEVINEAGKTYFQATEKLIAIFRAGKES